MNSDKLKQLLDSYQKDTLTEEQYKELEDWFHGLYFEHPNTLELTNTDLESRLYNDFQKRLNTTAVPKVKKLYRVLSAAASILLIASIGLFFYEKKSEKDVNQFTSAKLKPIAIKPGSDKAILKLADGKVIVLSNETKGEISYFNTKAEDNYAQNTIITPRAGQYRIILADGTKVWLNATSSLTFPVNFNNNKHRIVTLKGEGYFEVAKDKSKPFFVNIISDQKPDRTARIEVLGTHFNIMAYADEAEIKATLIEGSVKLNNQAKTVYLKPGQQGLISSNTSLININAADLEEAMAWKNGKFIFAKEDIHTIMRELERWYDVDVIYKGDFSGQEYSGTIPKYNNLSQVLNMLSETESVKFKLEGRRLTVMP